MGALAGLTAHGGTAGLLAEIGLVLLGLAVFGLLLWLGNRRRR